MLRLIKADLTPTGKRDLGNGAPSWFLNFRASDALLCEKSHFGFQIFAHEIEFVGATLIGWVDCGFSRWQGEDQPAMTRIHVLETEDIAEKCAVRVGVFTVEDYVSARDHLPLPRNTSSQTRSTALNTAKTIRFKSSWNSSRRN
jgi:hypothetical protein